MRLFNGVLYSPDCPLRSEWLICMPQQIFSLLGWCLCRRLFLSLLLLRDHDSGI
jgi:hypothetical protein